MTDSNSSPSDTVNSFVVRLWQEGPDQQRGTIRHVQSQTRQAFNDLEQIVDFIEAQIAPQQKAATMDSQHQPATAWPELVIERQREPAPSPIARSRWLPPLKLGRQVAWLTAGLLLLVVSASIVLPQAGLTPSPGTAAGGNVLSAAIIAFLTGLIVGGALIGLWSYLRLQE